MDPLEDLASALRTARSVVVITGAGISAESGIRTFRDTMDGLWKDFDPARLATPEAFAADPELVTRWYDHRRVGCLAAEPNLGHTALAELERTLAARGGRFTLLTQNVDRLHHRAGSRNVVELHGSIVLWRCTRCDKRVEPPPQPMPAFPPRADCCDVHLRPDVVWFGEMLPPAAIRAAEEAVADCDLFLSVGTSAIVYPAAGFAHAAIAHGASVGEINRDATPLSSSVRWSIRAKSGEALPQLLRLAFA